ncbi:MAG TPA: GNAT family N-acetyltransferase [Acidimicrobiales bacterium]|nr:GNAT family N-acetyltransferase [Acidimicrobiales bacterium]
MSVRLMTMADVTAVQAVQRAAGERFRAIPDSRIAACADHDPMTERELAGLASSGRAWVVSEDDAVIGFLAVGVLDGCAHVEEVSVHPAHGRRGHATALLRQTTTWAVEQGLAAVTLTTFRDVPWNQPFYERRGFRVLADDERSAALERLLDEEDSAYGLARELRVVMRLDVAS